MSLVAAYCSDSDVDSKSVQDDDEVDAYPNTDSQYPEFIEAYPNTDDQYTKGWREYRDYASGCTYFHNEATGISSWDEPSEGYEPLQPEPAVPPGWIVTLDENSGQYYFYHPELRHSTWTQPSLPSLVPPATQNDNDLSPEVAARLRALKGEIPAPQKRAKPWDSLRGDERREAKRRALVNAQIDLMDVSAPNYSDQFSVDPPISRYTGDRRISSKQTAAETAAVQAASALKAVTRTADKKDEKEESSSSAAAEPFRHFAGGKGGGGQERRKNTTNLITDSERRSGWEDFEARLARA